MRWAPHDGTSTPFARRTSDSPDVYRGVVSHQRWQPKRHGFAYEIFQVHLDLDVSEGHVGSRGEVRRCPGSRGASVAVITHGHRWALQRVAAAGSRDREHGRPHNGIPGGLAHWHA